MAIKAGVDSVLGELEISGLRGRGGAGFSTAKKWSICKEEAVSVPNDRVIVCNADEGEPGTFKDRVLLNTYADQVIEGMTLAALVVGASKGFIYLRGEYRHLEPQLRALLESRRRSGLLGHTILNEPNFDFDIELHMGAGAYICGEESALIESLEGKRGVPRNRPPFPVTHGYMGKPTVVNNVETFLASALITLKGGSWYASLGTPSSTGTKLLSISGDCEMPGIYEYPFGTSLRSILADCGAPSGLLGVQIGGPSGLFVSAGQLDRFIGYEDLSTGGSVIVFNDQRDLLSIVRNFMAFFAHESCGFCAPCRIGTTLMQEMLDKIQSGQGSTFDLHQLMELAKQVGHASHCGLGLSSVNPILSTMASMSEHYELRLTHQNFQPGFDLDASLAGARELTHRDDAAAHLDRCS
jgi:[NiFe] hydrogenase diaphorase moiety large subunit